MPFATAYLVIATLAAPIEGGRWQRMPGMPMGVFSTAASRSGDRIVITGGIDQLGQASTAVQSFDVKTRRWALPMALGAGRFGHAQVTLADGRLFIAGGRGGQATRPHTPLASAVVLDLKARTLRTAPDLPKPVIKPTAHVLDSGAVVVVGHRRASIYDPCSNQWTVHVELHRRRRSHASALVDSGRVLIVGGKRHDTLELVDLEARTSRLLDARLPTTLDDFRVVALPKDRALVLGGQDTETGDTTDQTWLIDFHDPDRSTIEPGPALQIAGGVADHCVVHVGPWLVVVGGESQRGGRDTELGEARLVDLATLTVLRLPPSHVPHDDAVAAADGGGVIVFGGYRVGRPLLVGPTVPVASRLVERLVLRPGGAR